MMFDRYDSGRIRNALLILLADVDLRLRVYRDEFKKTERIEWETDKACLERLLARFPEAYNEKYRKVIDSFPESKIEVI